MVITALLYFSRRELIDFFQNLRPGGLRKLLTDPAFYAVANYLVIVAWLCEFAWQFTRRWFNQTPGVLVNLNTGRTFTQAKSDMPTTLERATGYLFTRAAFFLFLAFFVFGVPQIISACQDSALTIGGACSRTALPPLWAFDMILALFMIGIGLVIFAQLVDKYARLRLTQRGVPNAEPGEERASTLRDTLFTLGRGAAANNRATPRIPSSLRYLLWPVLILIALVGVALVSQGLQWYLYGQ